MSPHCDIDRRANGQSRHARAGERGIALVSVLWVVAALALLMTAFNATVRTSATLVDVAGQSAQRRAALESALELTVVELLRRNRNPAQTANAARAVPWLRGAEAWQMPVAGFTFMVRVQDQTGLVDLNFASRELLTDLFAIATPNRLTAENIAARVIEWREAPLGGNGAPARPANSANSANDRQQRPVRIFAHPSQLRDQFTMAPALFEAVAPFLTVYGGKAAPDPALAPDRLRRLLSSAAGQAGAAENSAPVANASSTVIASAPNVQDRAGGGQPRAYALTIELLGATNTSTIGLRSIILLDADKAAPYRVLAWELLTG